MVPDESQSFHAIIGVSLLHESRDTGLAFELIDVLFPAGEVHDLQLFRTKSHPKAVGPIFAELVIGGEMIAIFLERVANTQYVCIISKSHGESSSFTRSGAVYKRNKSGESGLPWGTPLLM